MTKLLLFLGLLISFSATSGISIIVHPSNPWTIDNNDISTISKVFLGKSKSFDDSLIAIPINLSEENPNRIAFEKSVLNKSANQMKAYWSKLVFTGKGTPPQEINDETELVKLVSKNPNLIAYVDDELVNEQVKVIATF
ncbi:MAG: phosphate ABC transporter substrate-binding protein [Gammaproteobacteria bacterium]|nr:phosphate ABC transporter substrate-binding protein [Gammaproteobacteria bacterium]